MITTAMLLLNDSTRSRLAQLPAGLIALALVETVLALDNGSRTDRFLMILDGYGLHFTLEGDVRERDIDQAAIARMIQAVHPQIAIHIYCHGTAYDMMTRDGYEEVRSRIGPQGHSRFFLRPGDGRLSLLRAALPAEGAPWAEVGARYEALTRECRRLIKRQMAS